MTVKQNIDTTGCNVSTVHDGHKRLRSQTHDDSTWIQWTYMYNCLLLTDLMILMMMLAPDSLTLYACIESILWRQNDTQ